MSRKPKRTGPFTIDEIEEWMMFLAEQIDNGMDGLQPLLDYLEERYVALKTRTSQSDRVRKLMQDQARQA